MMAPSRNETGSIMWPPPDKPTVDDAFWKGFVSCLVILGSLGGAALLILFALGKI